MCLTEEEHFVLSSARKALPLPIDLFLCAAGALDSGLAAISACGPPVLLPSSTSAHPSIVPGIGLNSEMWKYKFKLKQYYLLFPILNSS